MDDFEIRKPDGTTPTGEELARLILDAGDATEHDLPCPRVDCPGKVEARASFWLGLTPDGMPFLDGIGWFEGGEIECSHGGTGHIPPDVHDHLSVTLAAYCAAAEAALGALKGEDVIRARFGDPRG